MITNGFLVLDGVNISNYTSVLSISNIILILIIAYLVFEKIMSAKDHTTGWLERFHKKRAKEETAETNLKEVMDTIKVLKDQIDILAEGVEDIKEMKEQLEVMQNQINDLQTNDKLISDGFRCVLRQQIITLCEKYIERKSISIKELEELEEVFGIYENQLHGNGTAHVLVNEVRGLKKTASNN